MEDEWRFTLRPSEEELSQHVQDHGESEEHGEAGEDEFPCCCLAKVRVEGGGDILEETHGRGGIESVMS